MTAMRSWLLLIIPLLALLALGCPPQLNSSPGLDDDDDDTTGDDDDDTQPQPYVWIDPTELDFGIIQVGGEGAGQVEVGNNGTGDLQIQSLVFSNTQVFSLLNGSDFDVLVAAGESTRLVVGFSPQWDGAVSGTLVIATDDPITPEITVQLTGTGVGGALDVQPISYDFGATPIGCERTLEVRVSNTGAPMYIEAIEFEDVAAQGEMTLHHALDFPLLIGAAIFTVEVRYLPIDLEPDIGTLSVSTDDPINSPIVVNQYGQGTLGADGSDAWSGDGVLVAFDLEVLPVPDTLEVSLNSVPVFTGWTYDSAANAVTFDADHVPASGDTIEATYTVWGCVDEDEP